MTEARIQFPDIKAGTNTEGGRRIVLYTLPKSTKVCELSRVKEVNITAQSYLQTEAERFLLQARLYKIRLEETETYDVYSTYGVEPGKRPSKNTDIEIQFENLVIQDGRLCGICFCNYDISLFFSWENPDEPIGKATSFTSERVYAQPLDYFVYTERRVKLLQSEAEE